MTTQARISLALLAAAGLSSPALAQGVDRYEFVQMQKQLEALQQEIGQLRGQMSGGRVETVEDELTRLIAQIERLEFAQRQHEATAKQKLEDLEYRIIELEGGDPSILFQQEGTQGGLAPGPAAPARPADPIAQPAPQQQVGSLGTLNSSAAVGGQERAAYDAGVASVRAGRGEEARRSLETFISNYPDSPLISDAHYWLGEAYFIDGDHRAAAERYLDGATLSPGAAMAPESLLKLGVTLGLLGRQDAGCSTLREVRQRYPQAADLMARADREASRAGCG
ncbi:MAG: tol-pal system protein YbgF [Paracoccaceae bacterium]